MPISKSVGARIKRREDPRLIQGLAHYVDDIHLPGTLHVAILRSPHAHARIEKINVEAARRHPGVVAVVTGRGLQDRIGLIPCAANFPGMKTPPHRILALDKVCFVGEPVVAVVAEDPYIARDAVDLIEVDYDPLPAVASGEEALRRGAPVIHDDQGKDNVAFTWEIAGGDVERALREADRVVKHRFVQQRLAPIALETRGVLAQYLPGEDQLTVWSSTQIPHLLRTQLAVMLRVAENRVRVIAPEVGGGFGSKLNVYAEEGLVAHLAIWLKRPVKWIEGRRENILHTIHGRDQAGEVEMAVQNDGTITGIRYTVTADVGAYYQLLTPAIPTLTGLMLCGCYKIQNVAMKLTGAFTNKMATDAYRGAGRPEATYLIERMLDIVADELNMDPVELRRKNFIAPSEFPYTTGTAVVYDSGDYTAALDKALSIAGYQALREEQARLRAQGRYLGIGVSTYVEICGMGPSKAMPAGGWESGAVRVDPTGKVTVLTGVSPHGQGQETTFAQIVADGLGVDIDDVRVMHGDTDAVQYGIGTFGSRATAVGGTAMVLAMQKVKEKVVRIAAHLLEGNPQDIVLEDGKYFVRGNPTKALTLADISLAAHVANNLPPDTDPGLAETHFFEPSNFTYPFGTHVAVVEVDADTGEVEVKRYVAVDDCGQVINPMIVEGQIHGGIAQGLGQALYEEVVYDENGQMLTGSLMDYALPKAHNFPKFELASTVTPTPVNPLGVKGVGEAGTIGSTPAVVNAVVDALEPFGVRHIDMPLRPEKVWRLMRKKPRRS
ncbi:MAG: carbon monoxide dehydrogenase [Candidatus Handelsmanbacteria bacterium RIFCSPLOWO2_12_FULL_64_10]|uniref:Carbon monoxide dehydrogenase n=1 Tax=Handelsmanbacteria sp. (strain RIFCSPLOWO2_12_FULL_64_10) TaxID=1817868 RepID=A0A1F6D684_HANXR|nr:MAG: carbon monoxide dehydrogenase [Candidatus Handelsmanbacteria bacterium RIFCSPLOWO2_12_FULL_64_10]